VVYVRLGVNYLHMRVNTLKKSNIGDPEPDPDPQDPLVFRPHGSESGSISQRYGSGPSLFP
jgi:hypothetical protein